jgi:membrane protease YdiL (CAAX protease family)
MTGLTGEPPPSGGRLIKKPGHKFLYEAILCSLGLMAFSYFIHHEYPLRLISFAALLLAAYIIGRNLRSFQDLKKITGGIPPFRTTMLYILIGISGGLILAALYRWYLEVNIFPESIYYFAIAGALIGSTEELVFRGFIQEHTRLVNAPFSILFSTLSHTGYKCCLFLSPMIMVNTDIGFLAFWTIIAGIIFGTIRHFSKSILPALVAHAIFDILVYAEYVSAPWWVW